MVNKVQYNLKNNNPTINFKLRQIFVFYELTL